MTVVAYVSVGMLLVAAAITLFRVLRPGELEDRAVALDVLTSVIICGVLVWAAADQSDTFLDVALALAVVGFLSAVTIARFIERGSE
jgi:multicomponent Na+:H+ antiporter subunit F